MTHALYLLGAPGAGKSTVLARLMGPWVVAQAGRLAPLLQGHLLIDRAGRTAGLYLGIHRPAFPGTDALGMAVHPHAVSWAAGLATDNPWPVIVGEGQRLGTAEFLTTLAASTDLLTILLTGDPACLAARRAARSATVQDPAWVKAATTRAARAADRAATAGVRVVTIDTTHTDPTGIADTITREAPWMTPT